MNYIKLTTVVLFSIFSVLYSCKGPAEAENEEVVVHAVTDLSHEFSFYADNRFHQQYLPDGKGVTNWCNLYNFDFSNANLLILLSCDDRLQYTDEDIKTIQDFLTEGGGVVIMGTENGISQNKLLDIFGASCTGPAQYPLAATEKVKAETVEGKGAAIFKLDQSNRWDILVQDAAEQPVMAKRKVGKGTLLVSSRALAGNHPSARDSINKVIWRPLLKDIVSGKKVDEEKEFHGRGIDQLEYNEDHGTFNLSFNDYMKPYANSMVDVYKRSFPYIENRMGVSLSPGMASQITLLATGGGGFSSGKVVALAVWWGGFPEREDSMIEFLTHESVHSWVLPFAEVWNEPIATYVGNLVMMDMGYEEEGMRRIQRTIERALKHDPSMKNYDIRGNLTGTGDELDKGAKNNIHWGKTYWVFEQLRSENPDFLADYFRLKRKHATKENITKYDMNNTVALLSMAMGKDLFSWFNEHGMEVDRSKAEIRIEKN
ncbi:hypothetical protein [uncultured Sunxiuqinia sp.]|uniref:hypothetical protein n=1 Tax=uncultured Sunxiuqinia sp. TaxID=1573825 RepID=UPI002625A74B|nr:hypothetical protein [uncultured Sunxiuqinia sp.]